MDSSSGRQIRMLISSLMKEQIYSIMTLTQMMTAAHLLLEIWSLNACLMILQI